MKKTDFKKYMQCGLGRCMIELNTCKDKERYRDIVLWGCLRNLSFDTQCEGTRAEYVYKLASAYNDDGYFLTPAIEKFEKLPANDDWVFKHFCDFILCFAKAGNETAKLALHKKYDELYSKLLVYRPRPYYGDIYREYFENVSGAIVELESVESIIKIANDIGNICLQNKHYVGDDFEHVYFCLEEKMGTKKAAAFMERESKKSAAVKTFYDAIKLERERFEADKNNNETKYTPTAQDIITAAKNGTLRYGDCIHFSRIADSEQKLILAQAIIDETDLNTKAEMLCTFRIIGFPVNLEEIVAYAKSDNENLRNIAIDVLAHSTGEAVRTFAIELLQNERENTNAFDMLIMNYRNEDKELLLSYLDKLKVDYSCKSGWHGVTCSIIDAFDRKIKLPKEVLLFLDNKSLCSCCRDEAVRHMAKRKWLTDDIKAELAFDSYYRIREYASKLR